MRLVYKLYGDGDQHSLVETDDNGEHPKLIEGSQPPRSLVKKMPAYVEISYDDRAEIVEKVRAALENIIRSRLSAASQQ